MRAAISQVWYDVEEDRRHIYGRYRYSLHQCYRDLFDAPGITPVAVLPLKNTDPAVLLEGFDILVLTGGGDPHPSLFGRPDEGSRNPVKDRPLWDMRLFEAAEKLGIPVIGICLGMQLMGISRGVPLVQHLKTAELHDGSSSHPLFHPVTVNSSSIMHSYLKENPTVSSWHHQALESVPEGFFQAAVSPDGVIEAIESHDHRFLGLQWHPERDETGEAIIGVVREMAGKQ